MGYHAREESYATTATTITTTSSSTFTFSSGQFDDHIALTDPLGLDFEWPFGAVEGLDKDDLRETAYEIFFTACRSTPGFGGRGASLGSYNFPTQEEGGPFSPTKGGSNGVGMAVTSKVKKSLGLKMLKRSISKRTSFPSQGGSMSVPTSPGSPGSPLSPGAALLMQARQRRPLTSAELMRQQMRVTEYNDNRLRKTLLRTLVGQMGRRAETIILPLELLRHLKPSEFNSTQEYHAWQRRQLKILETGLLINPSIPLDKSNSFAIRLQEIIHASETRPIDTSKNSEAMRTLCNSVVSLAWRSVDGSPTEVCHWADGYPFNIHLYISLLHSIFDLRDERVVVDEVDELLELIKKTCSMLGIGKAMHNLCFAWILFQQYIVTSQMEPDLLGAALVMLSEVAVDARRSDKEAGYAKMLPKAMEFMQCWSEKRLMNYHEYYHKGNVMVLENLVPLALTANKILNGGDVSVFELIGHEKGGLDELVDPVRHHIDHYIRSSVSNAFIKIMQSDQIIKLKAEGDESELLIQLADEVEDLALREKECFSHILRKWHPGSGWVAAVTLHACYGTELRQYLTGVSTLSKATVEVLERARKLEKVLLQMAVEGNESCKETVQGIFQEMSPFEVDSVILRLLRKWVVAKMTEVKECLNRSKETESWNHKSKLEPFAHSGMELVRIAKDAVDAFFENPITIPENLIHDLAEGLQTLFQDYASFVSSCGSKQNYIPALPPLTRCGRDSTLRKLLRKASPCRIVIEEDIHKIGSNEGIHPRQSMSRGTQRLYVRLNTLHHLQTSLISLDKTLSLAPRVAPSNRFISSNKPRHGGGIPSSYFGAALASIQTAIHHVAEVAGYRLIFLDSNSAFYDSLYVNGVANARIWPALRLVKQNLTLLSAIVVDKAQPLAMKEVMKATFEGYLTVLLAGGLSRMYLKSDTQMLAEDFDHLKHVFTTDGLLSEDVVEHEASVVEGVLELMGQSTEQLMEEFSIATCETSGIALMGSDNKLPMPPTTGRWNRSDPNTILRVLCYRKDRLANHFLKKTFQLARKR